MPTPSPDPLLTRGQWTPIIAQVIQGLVNAGLVGKVKPTPASAMMTMTAVPPSPDQAARIKALLAPPPRT